MVSNIRKMALASTAHKLTATTGSHVGRAAVSTKPFNTGLAAQLFGGTGEALVSSTESEKKYCAGLYADGIWERRNTDVGSFVYHREKFNIPYLSDKGETSFEYKLPKLPYGMLQAIAIFFRKIMEDMNNSEVMVQIFWSKSEEKYLIYVPVQRVSGASIKFDHSQELQNDSNSIWVLDIHSHNTMGAFFSGGDNADEISTRVFGVIGRLEKDDFASVWRAGVNGNFHNLSLEDIWDFSDLKSEAWLIADEHIERVSEIRYTYTQSQRASANNTTAGGTGVKYGRRTSTYQPYQNTKQHNPYWEDYYAQTLITHGTESFNRDTPFDQLFGELDFALTSLQKDIEDTTASEAISACGHSELNSTIVKCIDFFAEFTAFDDKAGMAVIEGLSRNLRKDQFNKLIELYSE